MPTKTNDSQSQLPVDIKVFASYSFKMEHSNPMRGAEALHWLAEHHQGRFVAWNVLYRAVVGCSRTPTANSQEALKLRNSAKSIRKHLFAIYKEHLLSVSGVGVRATFDQVDTLKRALPPSVRRFNSARDSMEMVADSIDTSKIPKTPENAAHLALLKDVKQITSFAERYPMLVPLSSKSGTSPSKK